MSYNFNDKEYSNYFSKLEESVTNTAVKEDKVDMPPKSRVRTNRQKAILRRRKFIVCVISVFLAVLLSVFAVFALFNRGDKQDIDSFPANSSDESQKEEKKEKIKYPYTTEKTLQIAQTVDSKHVLIMDLANSSVIAQRGGFERAYPASTTKIMTLLVAAENINSLEDTFTMTYEITDPLYVAGATVAGFLSGEVINLKDMLYGIILPSGGDASIGVAVKIAGSEKAFVELMNKKAKELGLKDTNFTNVTGLFDNNHYTTAADMAVILSTALKNPLCKEILSTYKYTTSPSNRHPDGIQFSSTLFNYMKGDEPEGADVLGGKTGFVNESGYCIASFGKNDNGEEFIVVTLEASTRWPAFYDQIAIYTDYIGKKTVLE